MLALRQLGYRRNHVMWRMSEWERAQLRHAALYDSGANVVLNLERDMRDNLWNNITNAASNPDI